ncbi:MAG: sensor histidine kinase [gamma proteobacterium symbiont of Bathyaustriella thionipta]|nr:sensor histidine kinase [gamma proteobacterium symbiont of Bathyaustriella thionipta]MCU7951130.1 sensor histidine kinase [gamma proteobacterium symbiont of Bathyaustriella thionipta]MCU7953918.1 sensor histidine kinase [gamma proteobacterium symbiont of Bathyaustriella thionipta]MCU7957645.1 sensor histidine kinase [gamma proteobacterium symbiont of Bathyaustriella thionipta]MCU7967213.1 sensor histidine kinase [gamma proteobacterium symbiont of Bathyaustriella thionipta]
MQNIIDAKQQWESTVDQLDVLICLLDKKGNVFRVNKTLEKWHLGNVRCVKGADVHDLLHPDCNDAACQLKNHWHNLWNAFTHNNVLTREFHDEVNHGEVRMTLLKGKNTDSHNDELSTLVIENTNESKKALTLLEEYSEELYSQVQNQTIKIGEISAHLENRIHEHKQDKNTLQLTEKRLLSLSAKLLTAQEEERKRIAAELHDGVGQSISAIKFNLESMLATHGIDNKKNLETVVTRLRDTVEEIRRISMGLRPSMIDDLGILITIQWLCRTFQQDHPGIKLEHKLTIDETNISEIQKVSIFRIMQEALHNIAKYSQADNVSIEITTEKYAINLNIEDDGIGFQPSVSQLTNGFGLCSMKERAKLSGGCLSIQSSPGNGTLIKSVWT